MCHWEHGELRVPRQAVEGGERRLPRAHCGDGSSAWDEKGPRGGGARRGRRCHRNSALQHASKRFSDHKRSRKTVFKQTLICRDARISLSLPAALSRAREIGRLAAWAVPWAIAHREDHQSCRRGHRGVWLAFIRSFRGGAPACCRVGALRVFTARAVRRRGFRSELVCLARGCSHFSSSSAVSRLRVRQTDSSEFARFDRRRVDGKGTQLLESAWRQKRAGPARRQRVPAARVTRLAVTRHQTQQPKARTALPSRKQPALPRQAKIVHRRAPTRARRTARKRRRPMLKWRPLSWQRLRQQRTSLPAARSGGGLTRDH